MEIYLITDTHFNHRKLVEYGRPIDYEDSIISGLDKIPPGSVLIHLGDICIGNDDHVHRYIESLPFKKILVKGNHDGKSNKWYLEHGWDFVCESFSDKFFGVDVTFSHMPLRKFKGINIHGHWHDSDHRQEESESFYNKTIHRLLAIEYTNYKPVKLQEFLHDPILSASKRHNSGK